MRHDKLRRIGCLGVIVAYIAMTALAVFLLCGCTSTRYVPVETVRTDSVRIIAMRTDSVHILDSVVIDRGSDTIRIDRWRIMYRDRLRVDTLWRTERDSVCVPYPVEKQLTKWEQTKMDFGGFAIGGLAALIAVVVIWIVRAVRRR